MMSRIRWKRPLKEKPEQMDSEAGVTLIELIIVVTILGILATAAVPAVKFQVKRGKERELRADLWEMRKAIDKYKDVADLGGIQTKADSNNYPPDLQTLVDGVDVKDKRMRFLRHIPDDPFTHNTDWGLRSNQDEPDAESFGGQNVYDVYSKAQGTALDGTKYSSW
jgi:general secretion pathway protein G